ncbi:MFS transporter [soil metagenome]
MNSSATSMTHGSLLAYGLFGLPLALVALPIYVYVPNFYAEHFGLSLTAIGAALLAARLFDAFLDPAIGWWIDRAKGRIGYGGPILIALPALSLGYLLLFHPLAVASAFPLAWFVSTLMLVYAGFSLATIAHQSWGAALSSAVRERSRISASRETCGLVGVVLAAALPGWLGIGWLSAVFILTLILGAVLLLGWAKRPDFFVLPGSVFGTGLGSFIEPFRNDRFRWLFALFVINGVAAAIPATLFIFFARDRLQLGQQSGVFLILYFAAAAISMPFWVALAKRAGEARAWLLGMLLSIAAFVWAFGLQAGASGGFSAICIVSGFALGADLVLPPALLAAVIAHGGHSGRREGAYFGAWNWATKMNLALAAGVSLPLLESLGYAPGTSDPRGLQALGLAYAVLPCLLKLTAAAILWRAPLRDL